ncbi:MAG: GRP family sugar transporter [Candidatus Hodarchaeota archaeon]
MPELIGYIFTLDALFTWGLASLVYKFGLSKGNTEPKSSLLFRLVIVSLSTFILSLTFGKYSFFSSLTNQELLNYLIACFISGFSVTFGDLLYFLSLKKIDASRSYPLTQLSLVFVYPFAFIYFGEQITPALLIGGLLILSSVFILSTKDKPVKNAIKDNEKSVENLIAGVLLAVGTAFFWALAIVSFNQARIISSDVFITNFIRVVFGTTIFLITGIFQKQFYAGFRKENRKRIKYYLYIGIAGSLSLGFADSLFYKAAEINGLVLTSTFTVNTPMVQQIFSILVLKEKFRKRFLLAVVLIIVGNYIILFI